MAANSGLFLCKFCGKIFPLASALISHELTWCSSALRTSSHVPGDEATTTGSRTNARRRRKLSAGERSLACRQCDKLFTTPASARRHERTHTDEHPYKCDQCERTFTQAPSLKNHMLIHMDERPFACRHCGARFRTKRSCLMHADLLHSADGKFVCQDCKEKFTTLADLIYHKHTCLDRKLKRDKKKEAEMLQESRRLMQLGNECERVQNDAHFSNELSTITDASSWSLDLDKSLSVSTQTHRKKCPKGPFVCRHCEKKFKRPEHCRRHEKVHADERRHACGACDKTFYRRDDLLQHAKTHLNVFLFACSCCDRNFKNARSLNYHERTHHGEQAMFVCQCGITFARLADIKRHRGACEEFRLQVKDVVRRLGASVVESEQRHAELFQLMLDNELKLEPSYAQPTVTGDPIKLHEFIPSRASQEIDAGSFDLTMFGSECSESMSCQDSPLSNGVISADTSLNAGLPMHLQRKESDGGPFTCSNCRRFFARKADLALHERIHTGECQYACTVCGKKFCRADALQQHSRVHVNVFLFACSCCEKKFKEIGLLHCHEQTHHSDEATFSCLHCATQFTQLIDLQLHRKVCDELRFLVHTSEAGPEASVVGEDQLGEPPVLESNSEPAALSDAEPETVSEMPTNHGSRCTSVSKSPDSIKSHAVPEQTQGQKCRKSPFECRHCGFWFSRVEIRRRHEKIHSDERRHVCSTCGKAFYRRDELRKHLKIHLDVAPFVCGCCVKKFKSDRAVRYHEMMQHGAEATCECRNCSMQFMRLMDLHEHRQGCEQLRLLVQALEHRSEAASLVASRWKRYGEVHSSHEPATSDESEVVLNATRRIPAFEPMNLNESTVAMNLDESAVATSKQADSSSDVDRPFACDYCEKRFSLRFLLQRHQLSDRHDELFNPTDAAKKYTMNRNNVLKRRNVKRPKSDAQCTSLDSDASDNRAVCLNASVAGTVCYRCIDCDVLFHTWPLARRHRTEAHGAQLTSEVRMGCVRCGEMFGSDERLAKDCFYGHRQRSCAEDEGRRTLPQS